MIALVTLAGKNNAQRRQFDDLGQNAALNKT